MKRIVLLDGNAIVHRAFHALPPLTSPDGKPVNAVYGFLSILLKIINELKPDYILATFDLAGPTFRHIAFERYKATRVKAPDELYLQFPVVKEALTALHIPIYEKAGYEADDIIGTAAKMLERAHKDSEIIIVTGDLDTLQLITRRTKVLTMRKGVSDTVLYDEAGVRERFGFGPERVVDYKGLRGDPSDNIPGVRGIGEKTAGSLIKQYGSIDAIYKHIKDIKPDGVRKKLEEQKEEAFFSKELATINTNVPIQIALHDALRQDSIKENKQLRGLFERLGFFSLLRRLDLVEDLKPSKVSSGPVVGVTPKTSRVTEVSGLAETEMLTKKIKTAGRFAVAIFSGPGDLFSEGGRDVCIIALEHGGTYRLGQARDLIAALQEIFEDEKIEKITYDAKKLALFLRKLGIIMRGVTFDILLSKYLLSAHERSYDPISIMREYGVKAGSAEELVPQAFVVRQGMLKKLAESKLLEVMNKIELPLVPVLTEMEFSGVALDGEKLRILSNNFSLRLEALTRKIYNLAGEEFNIGSPQQVGKILFKKLNLLEKGLRKTKGGAQSTRGRELQKLQGKHPIVDAILEYRELQKLKNTYIDVLPSLIDPADGRIHTTYNQTGTVTGRLSSSNPNLQNIPTRSELGKKIQSAFIASKGYIFCAFDYSQMELRIAAHMSNDKKLIKAFRTGVDIHALTAAEINNISISEVTPELRHVAKTLNFGVLYGMGARAFAESAGISPLKAKQFIEKYFEDFSGLRTFLDSIKKHARKYGYVETLFGRRRYIPELKSPYVRLRLEGERMAINMPIQGTEADIIKLAMIKIYQELILKSSREEIRLILQVHDELIFEVKKQKEDLYVPRIKTIMEEVVALQVPITVDVHIAENWGELKE